ncbi:MAG: C40 family peptidase [Deltaproteobacteria bacterium]|nr:C40 family peptidase [Deltaproteobacteria bacterium]
MSNIGVINVSVSSHYRDPSSVSDVTTQGLLDEQVELLETGTTHIHIRQKDGYQSWIPDDQIVPLIEIDGQDVLVRSHFMRLYSQPDESSPAVRDAVIGCRLKAVGEKDGWYHIALPDGTFGWAEKDHFGAIPVFSPESIISLAQEFLGYQYFWGGLTPKGFDCSGFVQTVFGLHGVQMPRDTWQQQQLHQVSTNFLDARPGDLLFFSNTPDRVTHVAISLGQQKYIHANGWIKINSFNENDDDFVAKWIDRFTSVNRYSL